MKPEDGMRILLVMTAREVGGAELYVERLVKSLVDRCHFTIALAGHPLVTSLANRLDRVAEIIPFDFDSATAMPGIVSKIQQLAANHDLVHINSSHPASRWSIAMGFALGGQSVPVACVEHRVTPVSDVIVPRSIAGLLPTLFRWSRRNVQRVVAVSRENAEVLVEYYQVPRDLIEVVHCGVDWGEYQRDSTTTSVLRQELGLGNDDPIILVLGRLSPNKGHRFLVEAAPEILARFPAAHFVFAGIADERAVLEQQMAELNVSQRFSILGFREDVTNLLQGSDLFVLPSLAEGFSVSIIEALATGLPVVATRVGGAAEIICDGENGFLVPAADAAALAQRVNHVLGLGSEEKSLLRQAALETAAEYSVQKMAEKMYGLYRGLLEGR